jgi:hypothetical protein
MEVHRRLIVSFDGTYRLTSSLGAIVAGWNLSLIERLGVDVARSDNTTTSQRRGDTREADRVLTRTSHLPLCNALREHQCYQQPATVCTSELDTIGWAQDAYQPEVREPQAWKTRAAVRLPLQDERR